MKRIVATVAVLCAALSFIPTSGAHNNGYAFSKNDVRARKVGVRWALNQIFPDFAPHEVNCRGLNPVRLRNGAPGYTHIRCRVESMNIPDYIFHLNARGKFFSTRAW